MDNSEKKAWAWWVGFMIVMASLAGMVSCGRRPSTTTDTLHTENNSEATHVRHETNTEIAKNGAIFDQLIATLGKLKTADPKCDSICQEAADQYLSQINHLKISGDNRYQLIYDALNKQLKLNVEMGETINELRTEKRDSIAVRLRTILTRTNTTKLIPVPYVPDFWRYSAYLGWAFAAYLIWKLSKIIPSWVAKRSIT
jgi:hypothetical protein